MKMNIKFQDGRGFPRIVMDVSDLFISIEEKRDGAIGRYGIHYCSKGESISHSICFFAKREGAEKFILKVFELINGKIKKPFWSRTDCKNTDKIIDLDKIREEVNNE